MFLLIVGTNFNAVLIGIEIIIAVRKPYAALEQLQHIFVAVFSILANAKLKRRLNAYGLQVSKLINQAANISHAVNSGQFFLKRVQSLFFYGNSVHPAKIKIPDFLGIAVFFSPCI